MNWDSDTVPGAADNVFVTSGSGGPTLTGSVVVFTLTVSNKTLTFQGTNTILTASNVTVAGASGKITHTAQLTTTTNAAGLWLPSNLVWIVCTNFDLTSSAAVNVDGMGYAGGVQTSTGSPGYGPGSGAGTYFAGGGGYGGGRIAVRCSYNHFHGTCSVTNGTGYQPGGMGTIYWRIQAPGTMFSVW